METLSLLASDLVRPNTNHKFLQICHISQVLHSRSAFLKIHKFQNSAPPLQTHSKRLKERPSALKGL